MRSDGTILGRHYCKLPKETDHLAHSINRIKKTQQHGNYKTPRLWAKAKGINHDSMAAGMASSAGTSKAFDYGYVALGWAKNKVKGGRKVFYNVIELSNKQIEVLIKYTGDDYVNINNSLRGMEYYI